MLNLFQVDQICVFNQQSPSPKQVIYLECNYVTWGKMIFGYFQ